MKPRVTVVLPAYNYAHFLPDTLASIEAQTFQEWECIVVDDGSTDNTWEVAQSAASRDRRIKCVRQANRGLSATRNTALHMGVGEYVQFLDADDLIEPLKLAKHVEFLDRHRRVGIVYGNVRYFPSDNPAERRYAIFDPDLPWMSEVSGSGDSVLRTLVRANIMTVNAPLVRRDVIAQVGDFNESLTSLEDWEYWIRCAVAAVRFQYLEEENTLALVRVHGSSMSQNRVRMLKQHVTIRKALQRSFAAAGLDTLNRWHLSQELGQLGPDLMRRGEHLSGLRCTLEACWLDPGRLGPRRLAGSIRTLLS